MEGHEQYDLLIKGGHVIDPANKIDELMDVAVIGDKIAKVAKDIPACSAKTVADAKGCYVTPGLIDIHAHVYPTLPLAKTTIPTVNADAHMLKAGVTTVVDAGTVGWGDFQTFKEEVVDASKIRVLSLINIACRGMVHMPSEQTVADMHPKAVAGLAATYPDIIVGVKAAHYHGAGVGPCDDVHPAFASVDKAVEAGELANLPVMIDFQPNGVEQSYRGMLKRLRKGDIHTHVFAQQFPIVDKEGKVYEHMWEARERGILFDLGHGAGSFWFRNAQRAYRDGFAPDTLSTDLHMANIHGVVLSQLHIVSKYHNMGMPLQECIMRATSEPAKVINRPDLGTLSEGACADIAVIKKYEGEFDYIDCGKAKIKGNSLLHCYMTVRAGEVVYDGFGLTMPEWENAPERYWYFPREVFV